jgi:hypothetical protein
MGIDWYIYLLRLRNIYGSRSLAPPSLDEIGLWHHQPSCLIFIDNSTRHRLLLGNGTRQKRNTNFLTVEAVTVVLIFNHYTTYHPL